MIKLDQFNFHHLYYFWRVAKLGHLTRAAETLHTSQSAVSSQIHQLETRIGQSLFVRERRRLTLTDAGQLAFSYAEQIFGLGQEMLGRLQGSSAGITRTMKIPASSSTACPLVGKSPSRAMICNQSPSSLTICPSQSRRKPGWVRSSSR